jgi:hypothetical protein
MFLVDAEDDGLGKAIRLFQKIRDIARDRFGSRFERDRSFEIARLVLIVRNFTAIAIKVALTWPPACCISFGDDAVNSIRRQKTILDTLAQTIGVDRIAEVSIGIAIFFPQRRRSHTQRTRAGSNSRSRANCSHPWRCRDDIRRR